MTMAMNTVTVSSKYKYTGIVTMYLGGVEYKILYPTLLSQMLSFIHHFKANDGVIMLQSIVKETCFDHNRVIITQLYCSHILTLGH